MIAETLSLILFVIAVALQATAVKRNVDIFLLIDFRCAWILLRCAKMSITINMPIGLMLFL